MAEAEAEDFFEFDAEETFALSDVEPENKVDLRQVITEIKNKKKRKTKRSTGSRRTIILPTLPHLQNCRLEADCRETVRLQIRFNKLLCKPAPMWVTGSLADYRRYLVNQL